MKDLNLFTFYFLFEFSFIIKIKGKANIPISGEIVNAFVSENKSPKKPTIKIPKLPERKFIVINTPLINDI